MATRKSFALMVAAAIVSSASLAHAGKETVPSAPTVFSPAATVAPAISFTPTSQSAFVAAIVSAFNEVRAGTASIVSGGGGTGTVTTASGATVTANANGTVTVTLASGATTTISSGFIISLITAYL